VRYFVDNARTVRVFYSEGGVRSLLAAVTDKQ